MGEEIAKLTEELNQKEKIVIEMEQTLKNDMQQANAYLEELVFKEKTAKSEMEMLKIEMNNYKSELNLAEETVQSQKDQIFYDAQI